VNIGLVDIDSHNVPNLALMKISSYHKQRGDDVELCGPLFADQYDKVYASKIFRFSEMPKLPDGTIIGGSGYDLSSRLPEEMENQFPDYSLYNCDYAIGFTSRGCNRRCPFCIVPKKEGRFRVIGDIYNFWNGQSRLMLLDNSLNTDEIHFEKIAYQIIKNNIEVDFSQGLDIRHMTDSQAEILSHVKLWKRIHFAWDFMEIEKSVINGIEKLIKHIHPDNLTFYVLIGYNTTEYQDLHRVMVLKDKGVNPFVMPFNKHNPYQKRFARWVNHKAIFKSVSWAEYLHNHKTHNHDERTMTL